MSPHKGLGWSLVIVVLALVIVIGRQGYQTSALRGSESPTNRPYLRLEILDLRLFMTTSEVEKALGAPDAVDKMSETSYWWRYEEEGLLILFMGSESDAPPKAFEIRQTKGAGVLGIHIGETQDTLERQAGATVDWIPGSGYQGIRLAQENGNILDVEVQDRKVAAFVLSVPWEND